MARAVVGGLITSTMLTLIVVPVVYAIFDDITAWLFRKRGVPVKHVAALLVGAMCVTGVARPARAGQAPDAPRRIRSPDRPARWPRRRPRRPPAC